MLEDFKKALLNVPNPQCSQTQTDDTSWQLTRNMLSSRCCFVCWQAVEYHSFYTNLQATSCAYAVCVITLFYISSFCNMSTRQPLIHIRTWGWTLTTNCRTGTLKQEKWTLSGKQVCSGYWSFMCKVFHFNTCASMQAHKVLRKKS